MPVTCTSREVVAVEFDETVAVGSADDVVDIGVLVVEGLLESWVEVAEVVGLVTSVVVELVVAAEELVGWVLEALVDSAEGGMTLKLTVAPHSAREDPVGQQPALVQ